MLVCFTSAIAPGISGPAAAAAGDMGFFAKCASEACWIIASSESGTGAGAGAGAGPWMGSGMMGAGTGACARGGAGSSGISSIIPMVLLGGAVFEKARARWWWGKKALV
jgi:hypothetical protein